MIQRKHGTWNLLALGIPLLAVGILFSWMGFKALLKEAAQVEPMRLSGEAKLAGSSSGQELVGNEPRDDSMVENRARTLTATKPKTSDVTDSPDIRFDVRSVNEMKADSESGYELRCERRELSMTIPDLFRRDSSPPPESLSFPLFDGEAVQLKSLRHQSMGRDQGVVLAKADGETEGGHVLLSYVGTALAGMIHLPLRGEFYEIRTGPDGRSHILTQLDPAKMPVCGGCPQHPTE